MRKNLRKWLLGVIAAVSLAVTACQGADVASGAGAATDIAQAAGDIREIALRKIRNISIDRNIR